MIKTAIIGATGYVGEELVRILSAHPQAEISYITSQSNVGQKYSDIYPNFKNIISHECIEENIEELAEKVDVIFFALPHGIACKKIAKKILDKVKVIDLGADFRLRSREVYEEWYKTEHESPELLEEAVYGLCEWKRDQIKNARLIANPGCYTTCSILSLLPLLKEGLIDTETIIVDAKSGVTGAGRSLSQGVHFAECNETTKAYKIADHRHTPEIEQELSEFAGKEIKLTFTPTLVPMQRGILSTCYAKLLDKSLTYDDVKQVFMKYYEKEYFIRITEKEVYPETRWVRNSNFYDVGFKIDRRTGNIIVVGAIDNLVKGASGQAVQNMNILFKLDEKTGLQTAPFCL
ncbi:MAG TPA: N-acetyl-gamma-glutamyl-phosphate reductase [Candidatus Gastranaerophilales bacterium]|nr:N-acetyl-gamma-glutamyl-phosphate reductase [Candidatus Gastranaerophilales bacterium]